MSRITATACWLTLLWATSAHAQIDPCEQLKTNLAARIESTGVRGYSLEAVPSSTPVPRDAKVIGNCAAGATKILYRRFGGSSQPAAAAASAAPAAKVAVAPTTSTPTPTPTPAVRPAPPPPPTPALQPTPQPSSAPVARAPQPPAAPPAKPVAAPPARPLPIAAASTPLPPPAAPPVAAASAAAPARPALPLVLDWSRHARDSVNQPAPVTAPTTTEPEGTSWWWALVLLPGVVWAWLWWLHYRAYDAAGLPRGPRLTY